MFLSEAEIRELTGYKSHAMQIRWLNNRGWMFETSRTGRPIIGKAYADQRLGLSTSPEPQKRAWKPNIAALAMRV